MHLILGPVRVANTQDRELTPVCGNEFDCSTAPASAKKPGANPGECMIMRYTFSDPCLVTASRSSGGSAARSG